MSYQRIASGVLIALAATASVSSSTNAQTLVAHWVADDLANGTVFTLGPGNTADVFWTDRVASWQAGAEPGPNPLNNPKVDATKTIGLNNRKAVSFNEPDTSGGGLNIDAGEGSPQRNPVVGLDTWSATVVFQTNDPAGGGGDNVNPGGWWMNGALLGIELGGGERGDWSIWMTDGNATGGAKLGASRGDPDGGAFYDQVVNDGQAHAVTATFELNDVTLNHDVNLYLDGSLVSTAEIFSGGLNNAVENFNLRIGSHNNFGFFKGRIGEVQLHDGALALADVQSLHANLDTFYGFDSATGGNADFNGDGEVDGADFLKWQRGFGLIGQTNNANGDATGDGEINGADLDVWKQQFGGAGFVVGVAAIPEPSAIVLLVLGVGGIVARRSCRR